MEDQQQNVQDEALDADNAITNSNSNENKNNEQENQIQNEIEGINQQTNDQNQPVQQDNGMDSQENQQRGDEREQLIQKFSQLPIAVGKYGDETELKIILAETQTEGELIAGKYDIKFQQAFYGFDGKEQVSESFKVVEGFLLPQGEKAPEADMVGIQSMCPTQKWEGPHHVGIALSEHGQIPGKVKDDTCYYTVQGFEHQTKEFQYVAVKAIDGQPIGSAAIICELDQQNQTGQNTIQYSQGSSNKFQGGLYAMANPNEMIDQLPSDYIYSEMFKAFDVSMEGQINKEDMAVASKALGWKKHQLDELITELDPNHSGQITFEEFVLIMKYIEQKQAQLPPMNTKWTDSQASKSNMTEASQTFLKAGSSIMSQELSIYEQDKRKYGALLPKIGVYFLPDERIVAFLKIMNEIRKRYEGIGDYMMANKFKKIFDRWSEDEQNRQSHNMRIAQQRELVNIENAQKIQYQEFAEAWDKYMADYEATAFNLVENLKIKQIKEIEEMRLHVTEKFYNDHRWNKQIIDLRKQERIYFSIKDYVNAEKVKLICQSLEKKEVDDMQEQLGIKLTKEESTTRTRQQNQMQALLRRIQRDREEQVKHRQVDSNRLIQRNKNLLNDILEKQGTEKRRTQNFLKYSLRKREEKTEEEIAYNMKNSNYDPKADPLMPRLFRKFDPSKSDIIMGRRALRGGSSITTLRNKEKFNNLKTYAPGQGYGSKRTYMCINPYRAMSKNKELASHMRSLANDDTERALLQLEDNYNIASGKNLQQFNGNFRSIQSSSKII